jgi:hypothetical protein
MMLTVNSHACILNSTNNHLCNRRIPIHPLSLCTGFIEPRLSSSRIRQGHCPNLRIGGYAKRKWSRHQLA